MWAPALRTLRGWWSSYWWAAPAGMEGAQGTREPQEELADPAAVREELMSRLGFEA